ncbi:MAG TPA: L,D-transpeptidase [Methylomirabilota bacterium]|jgi:murein L,D-transpeptidase YafK|nr:L,D-transpeptidase [Methylomirabilota bacterium]
MFRCVVVLIVCGVVGLAGCAGKTPPSFPPIAETPPVVTPLPHRTDSDAVLAWASEERVMVVVDKTCGTLNLYQYGRLLKTYPAVFGRKPGKKIHEGDQRTPSGLYMIIDKGLHNRWSRFMRLDYPNENDRLLYRKNVTDGKVPKRADGYAGLGGAIGIHGTDNEAFNRARINWTLGCISLLNKDVQELYRLAPVGTLVYIKD